MYHNTVDFTNKNMKINGKKYSFNILIDDDGWEYNWGL